MSFVGLAVIILFSFVALAAPVLTPYSPQGSIVSGQLDPPSWYPALIGGSWSQNAQFADLKVVGQGVQVNVIDQTVDSVNFSITKSPSSVGSVIVMKTIMYTQDGPPQSFQGKVEVIPSGLTSSGAAAIVYLRRADYDFTLWQSTFVTGDYNPPTDLTYPSNFTATGFAPTAVMFSQKTEYTYALRMDLPTGVSRVSFNVKTFAMLLMGTTWGFLGTDNYGHDLYSQFVYGARVSLIVGLVAASIGIGVGLVVGLLAGYLGRVVDEVLMRFTDMMLVIPSLPLIIVLVAVLGPSLLNIIFVLGFLGWMGFARVIRSQVLSLRERPFIEAAKASGAGTGYITTKHIFPNIVSLTYVNLALSVPGAIVGEAALSFLGLGPQTVISWGQMLELAHGAATSAGLLWWWIIPPGIGIAVLSLSFILIGYALDEMFNPRLRKRH
jgi:ABC-type dipeptide/oligopeptide/nickel transport system permease subunit